MKTASLPGSKNLQGLFDKQNTVDQIAKLTDISKSFSKFERL